MQKFVARQPILDSRQRVYGYELLFRSGLEACFSSTEPDAASSSVLVSSFLLIGIEELTAGRCAFINFTRNLLTGDCAGVLPSEKLVVEVLETIEPDAEVVGACQNLQRRGCRIALDDFIPDARFEPLVQIADIIKVDVQALPRDVWTDLPRRYLRPGLSMLAEKVETHEEFRVAESCGYSYFQGFFFSRPETVSGRDIPAFKLHYVRLLSLAASPAPDLAEIEQVVKSESSLCYKLLRYVNSPLFGFARSISSIRHALALLGLDELRRLASLLALAGLAEGKPSEILVTTMIRARFAELAAPCFGLGTHAGDLFLMGLLSTMDVILQRPLAEILADVAVSSEVRAALLGEPNALRQVHDLVLAYERGDWIAAAAAAERARTTEHALAECYLQAVSWGQRAVGAAPRSAGAHA